MEIITALILSIAAEVGIPPYFALAVALIENPQLDQFALSDRNANGSIDRGVMQLNSYTFPDINWSDPETNIRAGCEYLKHLADMDIHNTWWAVAISYNCGYNKLNDPPVSTIGYAGRVINKWEELDPHGFYVVINKRRGL